MKSPRQNKKRISELLDDIQEEPKEELNNLFIVLAIILFIALAFFIALVVLPPHTRLSTLQDKLRESEKQLDIAKEKEEIARKHLEWMQDPEYTEQIARDQADQALNSETIIQIKNATPDNKDSSDSAPQKQLAN